MQEQTQTQAQPRVRQLRADAAAKMDEAATFFAALTPAEAATRTEIGWTVAATVAHLALATDFTSRAIAAVRAGKERTVPDRVIDALNFVTVRANTRTPIAASVPRLRAATDGALRQLDILSDADLNRPHQAPFRGATTFGVRLRDAFIGHFDQHMGQIRRALARQEATTTGSHAPAQSARRGASLTRTMMRAVTGAHVGVYRRTGGALGGQMAHSPVLLLTTVGRKSGKPRTTPLLYLADGDTFVTVASAGGAPTSPLWWRNLEANPEAMIEIGRCTIPVHMAAATGDEKQRLWARLVAMYPDYAAYQRKTTREIPVVVLRPTSDLSTPNLKEHAMSFDYRGGAALITGASSGIGEAFAHELASRGMSVVLVARSEGKLNTLAASLVRDHGVRAEVIVADMSEPGAAQAILAETQARDVRVHLLVNNAGFATYGPFDTLDPARDHEEVQVNVAAVVGMAHAFLPQMIERSAGGIINVASLAAFQAIPYLAVYSASKAFVLSFSEALWAENRTRGVRVLALCPGETKTAFFDVSGVGETFPKSLDTPEHVVATALHALERGRNYTISGPNARNYLLANSSRFIPRWLTAQLAGQITRPRTPTKTLKARPQSQM